MTQFILKNGTNVSGTIMVRPLKVLDRLKKMFCNGVITHLDTMKSFHCVIARKQKNVLREKCSNT